MKHVTKKIQACLDGELSAEETALVQAHCRVCATCGRQWQETERVWQILAEDSAPSLPRSHWPTLRTRINTPGRAPGFAWPWGRFTLVAGSLATVVGGLGLGLWLGNGWQRPANAESPFSLLEIGAVISEGSQPTLDQLYLATVGDDPEDGS